MSLRVSGLLVLCLFVFFSIQFAFGAVWKGTVSGEFNFIGKFVFEENDDPNVMVGTTNFTISTSASGMKVALYDDESFSWPAVWNTNMACTDKLISCADGPAPPLNCHAKKVKDVLASNGTYDDFIALNHNARSRFFFLALVRCGQPVVNVDYTVHFVNVLENSWNNEFGADQMGLNTMYLVYFLAYLIFAVVQAFSVFKLYKRLRYLHPLVRLFILVIVLEVASITLELAHYGLYTKDGMGLPAIMQIGDVLDVCSRLLFFLLLLLLARGWTISNHELKYKSVIIASIVIFIIVNVGVLIWQYAVNDPASTSINGGLFVFLNMLIAIDLIFAITFIGLAIHSYRIEENPHKKALYLKLLIFFGPWSLAPPLTSFAVYQLDDWARDRVVRAITVTLTAVAYFVLSAITWHSNAEEYFDIQTPDIDNAIGYEHL